MPPGAATTVRAALTEYGIPVTRRASVWAELQRPDHTEAVFALAEVEPGVFETTTAGPPAGVYRFRVLAAGVTMRGVPFTREQLLSGAVYLGDGNPLPNGDGPGAAPRGRGNGG